MSLLPLVYSLNYCAFHVKIPSKMRSAQAPFGTWAIMKKFIYVCND